MNRNKQSSQKRIRLILIFSILFGNVSNTIAQSQYLSKTGHISFFSNAPLENIEAHNHQVLSLVDVAKNEISVNVLMKAFEFEKSLMQEHFNENYVESDLYPKAKFEGKLVNLGTIDFSKPGTYKLDVEGVIKIHGIEKNIKTKVEISIDHNQLIARGNFRLNLSNFGITIPQVVFQNIANEIDVKFEILHNLIKP